MPEVTPEQFIALLEKKAREAPFELHDAVSDMVGVFTETTRALEPKKTGFMASQTTGHTSVLDESHMEGVAGVLKTAPQALWLTEGTGIYGPRGTPIVPVHAAALHFFIGDREFFRQSVRGTPVNDFFDQAVRGVNRSYIPQRLKKLGEDAVKL